MRSLWLADYTWPEVEELIAKGVTTLLLMLGATEQHGPHLPLATDTLIAEALAQAVAARLGHTLIAPIVPLGASDEHLAFAGTLSLSKQTLAALIADVARSATTHGFTRLLVFSSHGGNYDAVGAGVAQARAAAQTLAVLAVTELDAALRMSEATKLAEVPLAVAGLHAGEYETSQILHLRPDLARMERAEAGYSGDMHAVVPRLMQAGLRPVTPNGVLGDPTPALAERGARYIELQAQALAAFVDDEGRL